LGQNNGERGSSPKVELELDQEARFKIPRQSSLGVKSPQSQFGSIPPNLKNPREAQEMPIRYTRKFANKNCFQRDNTGTAVSS
jgi:hypothetical protein